MTSTLLRHGTLVTATGEHQADVLVKDGRIHRIGTIDEKADSIIDCAGKLILPGLIDCHVHFREPGLERKATMKTESASALAGGVTTVCEMPNTVPPTTTVAALADKVRRANEIEGMDLRFFFGITEDAHLSALRTLWAGGPEELERLKSRCCGVKLYLDHSTGNQKIEGELIEDVFKACAEHGIVIVAHCEDAEMNEAAWRAAVSDERSAQHQAQGSPPVSLHSQIRSPESERKSVEFAIGMAKKTGAHLHVAHASTSFAIDLVRNAKTDGISVTCEVAPHHLFLTVEDYPTLGTLGKMNPPLRSMDHRDALWRGIMDGTVDCVSTDHAPHTLEEKKTAEPLKAPSGVPGVETMLPLLMTVAESGWPHPKSKRPDWLRFIHSDIVRLCHDHPNRIFGLGKKGIAEGAPADVIVIDPREEWVVSGKKLKSKCEWSCFEGWGVRGGIARFEH